MRKTIKKFLTVALAAVLAVSAFAPVNVQAASTIVAPETLSYYQSAKGSQCYFNIDIYGLSKSDTIKKSSVKSSKPKSTQFIYLTKTKTSTAIDKKAYVDGYAAIGELGPGKHSYDTYTYQIQVCLKKPGTYTISYKINNKTYKTKVKFYKYENPIKTLTVTGVNKGKNLAGSFKTASQYHAGKLTKNVSSAKVKVVAKKNWKITKVTFSNSSLTPTPGPYGGSAYEDLDSLSRYYRNGKSSVTLDVKSLSKKKAYSVGIEMTNTKTGQGMYYAYSINTHLFK